MSTATKTLKLPFLRLNRAKAEEFARLQALNTQTANAVLALSKADRKVLTTKAFGHVEIGSAWMNQTIRHANARTKVKQFRCLPLETNNQNWTLHKVGSTYSLGFGLLRGIKKRVPIAVHQASHQELLEALLAGRAKAGSLKRQAGGSGLIAVKTFRWPLPPRRGRSSSTRRAVFAISAGSMPHDARSCKPQENIGP